MRTVMKVHGFFNVSTKDNATTRHHNKASLKRQNIKIDFNSMPDIEHIYLSEKKSNHNKEKHDI